MTKRLWTAAQQAAIDYDGRNLLLSASAGSGKTATLTERIVSLLLDETSGAEITRMLCVTFTRAAALELRERIRQSLRDALAAHRDSARLRRQLCDLSRAQITTIHSFCLHALRPHAAEFGLPAEFSVAEEASVRALARQTMADVLSDFFDAGEPWFLRLADTLGGARREDSLDEAMLSLAETTESCGISPEKLMELSDRMEQMDRFFASPAGAGTRGAVLRFAQHYAAYFTSCCTEFAADEIFARAYLPTAEACCRLAERLIRACLDGSYTEAREALRSFSPPARIGIVKEAQQTPCGLHFKTEKKTFCDAVKRLLQRSFPLPEEEIAVSAIRTAEIGRAAARVLRRYRDVLDERKRDRGMVDFGDLESLTARLFTDENGAPTAAALSAGAAYDYIFIDEYQDTNRQQDAIFAALASAGGRRFMVGDIKQSIYRFRGAEPDVFAGYRRAWPPLPQSAEAEGCSLFMRENFRCDRTVVDFVNRISGYLFSVGSIPHTADDALVYAKNQDDAYVPSPVEVRLIPKNGGDASADESLSEAEYVARRISAMLGRQRRADGVPLRAGDVAILLRSPGADGAAFAEALRARGIRVASQTKRRLLEEPEILLLLSILRSIDNPSQDIPLAAAMKSPVFGFTLDDLLQIRQTDMTGSLWDAVRQTAEADTTDRAVRCASFVARLAELRTDARGMRSDALILRLCGEMRIAALAEADPTRDSSAVQENLRALYDLARRFENGIGGGLYAFLRYVEEMEETGGEETTTAGGEDAVQLLSIHHAKGLEYPVCFLCRTEKKRNARDTAASVLFDASLGAAMRLPDEGGLAMCDTPLRRSVAASMTDSAIEEEMRVLYVAMTRARERLIVTASLPDPAAAVESATESAPYATAYSVYAAPNYITWILDALAGARLRGEDVSCADVAIVESLPETDALFAAPAAESAAAEPDGAAKRYKSLFAERFAWQYPAAHLAQIPAKLTVSRLYPGILDGTESEPVRLEIADGGDSASRGERNRAPRFLSGKTEFEASFAGTATHVFMQFCDFSRLYETGAAAELARLRASGFLTEAMAAAVRLPELEKFRKSALLQRMLHAREMHREFRFNAAMPAEQFTQDAALADALRNTQTEIVVQGVVDCLFLDADGNAVLVDYKTDRLTAAEKKDPALAAAKLIPRHATQLRYYRTVCEAMLGRAVEETCLYSLALGDTVRINEP